MNGGVFRKKKVYFSQVSNAALRDNGLSLKAKGLYALIQSYITIEGFTLYKNTLLKDCKESETAFESAWNELKDAGYLKQDKFRNAAGHFVYEYELLDEKDPKVAKQNASHHTPKTEGVDALGDGEHGVYNNTHIKNTDLNNTEKENECPSDASARSGPALSFSKELTEFVDEWYPSLAAKETGYHEPLKPEQRIRTLQILKSYMRDYNEDVEGLMIAAEMFFNITGSDGNIKAFANPKTISLCLTKNGCSEHYGDFDFTSPKQ